jgi:sec-independent protein translocase protein TatA
MGSMSIWHWLVVAVIVLVLFGRGKITELMGDVASGIKAFKKGMAEEEQQKVEEAKPIDNQTAPAASTASTQKTS